MSDLPHITGLTVTYGRTERLQELLACWQAQDYRGPKELLILNSCPRQRLHCDLPDVRVVNLEHRPGSLGAARNLACSMAKPGLLVTMDDDDLFLHNHLSHYGQAYAEQPSQWIRLNPVAYAEGWQIKKPFSTWANAVAFTKDAWLEVGGYAHELSCGEDRQFIGKLSSKFGGRTVTLPLTEISAVYCWANNVHHVSGEGDDRAGTTPCYERSRVELEDRLRRGVEPSGDIHLKPKLEHSPVVMLRQWLEAQNADLKKKQICVVELGRYGDIINILPLLHHIAQVYGRPALMVSRDFADLLDAVSYVEPRVVNLRYDLLPQAVELARKDYRHVFVAQVWGTGWVQEKKTASYNRASWHNLGFGHWFERRDLPPVFDRRNMEREDGIYRKLNPSGRPMILVGLNGHSSPFAQAGALLESIRKTWSKDFLVVDLATLKLPHFVDVLGLMDRAACLVSADTAYLHFAAASKVRVVGLVNPNPWQGSELRCHAVARIPYDKVNPEREFFTVNDAIWEAVEP